MSIPFNDTTNNSGLVQLYEEEIGANPGDVSGNPIRLQRFVNHANLAKDRYFAIAIQASGTWQLDDSNHTDSPFIVTDLVSGQRDYSFTNDGGGNLILDIYKVMVKDQAGVYHEISAQDQQRNGAESFYSGLNNTGVPSRYDKTGNAIYLDFIPSYNSDDGLKIFINRESSHYTVSDTTKPVGYPYHQEYVYLKPAYETARINSLACLPRLENEITRLEGDVISGKVGLIAKAYGNRAKDEISVIEPERINSI